VLPESQKAPAQFNPGLCHAFLTLQPDVTTSSALSDRKHALSIWHEASGVSQPATARSPQRVEPQRLGELEQLYNIEPPLPALDPRHERLILAEPLSHVRLREPRLSRRMSAASGR